MTLLPEIILDAISVTRNFWKIKPPQKSYYNWNIKFLHHLRFSSIWYFYLLQEVPVLIFYTIQHSLVDKFKGTPHQNANNSSRKCLVTSEYIWKFSQMWIAMKILKMKGNGKETACILRSVKTQCKSMAPLPKDNHV